MMLRITTEPGIFAFECEVTEFRNPEPGERIPVYVDCYGKLYESPGEGRAEIGYVVRVVPKRTVEIFIRGTESE